MTAPSSLPPIPIALLRWYRIGDLQELEDRGDVEWITYEMRAHGGAFGRHVAARLRSCGLAVEETIP